MVRAVVWPQRFRDVTQRPDIAAEEYNIRWQRHLRLCGNRHFSCVTGDECSHLEGARI